MVERRGNIRGVPAGGDAARVPPHDLDAERAVIGAMLVSETAVSAVAEQIAAEDFYSETNRIIYASMMRLYSRGERIDQITLTSDLNSVGEFEKVGGRRYIFDIVESVPTASNAARYAEIVRGKSLLRSVIDAGSRITEDAFREPDDVSDALDSAEQLIYNISNRSLKDHLSPVSELAPGALEMIQNLYAAEGEITGVETGFEDLDRLTTGFHKSDLVVLAARPAMGKCLAADSEIVLDDGSVATIEEVYGKRRGRMMTLGENLTFSWTGPSAFVDDGMKPVFRVRTRLGREIETTITHPFLTFDGWRELGEIPVGERIAVPRRMPVFGDEPLGEHRIRLLAYMIGDGCMKGTTPRFTNGNEFIRDDFREAAECFGGLAVRECDSSETRTPTLRVSSDGASIRTCRRDFARAVDEAVRKLPYSAARLAEKVGVSPASISNWRHGATVPDDGVFSRLSKAFAESGVEWKFEEVGFARKNARNALAAWLRELGLWGAGARDKFVPRAVFKAPKEEVALFLNRLFATDGWATLLASGQAQIGYCSVSEKLARQIQHLLLRFGVIASLRKKMVKYGGSRRAAYQLDITSRDSILAFIEEIGVFGKEEAVEVVALSLTERKPHSNRDLIPAGAWKNVEECLDGESWASLSKRMGHGAGHHFHVGRRMISRPRMLTLADALDDRKLRELAESDVCWDQIVSVEPLGTKQVYDLTIPETHNFVANDICVHNTAFALNAIWHAAGEKKAPVAIFSLEMSKEQLVQRLISQTTRIPTQALRSGNVKAEDWPKLLRGVAQVSEAPIWIDDNAATNLMEMRAKTRRLSSQLHARGENPLSLVVVDYLQLMMGSNRENRQQEIAEISRGLKVLARDLDVPVLAIAQLSRAVESRHDKRPMLSDLRDSGCLTGDSRVFLPDEGVYRRMDELVGTSGFRAMALNRATWKLEPRVVTNAFSTGRKRVFEIVTRLGRRIRATANHKFLAHDGWRRLDELEMGERLALPRRLPGTERRTMSDAELALLAHMIGDGCALPRQPIHYTTNERPLAEKVVSLAREVFGEAVSPRVSEERAWFQVYLSATAHLTHGKRNPVAAWMDRMGVFGLRSHEKRIPDEVFAGNERAIALFLRHLWATDGCIHFGKGRIRIYYATSSAELARNVQSLLLRLGINARRSRVSQGEKGRDQFHVDISGKPEVERFLTCVGGFGKARVHNGTAILEHMSHRKANTNRDVLPRGMWRSVVVPAMKEVGVSSREMQSAIGQTFCGTSLYTHSMSRERAARVAMAVSSVELARLAESDVYWDEIISIEPAGEEEVFDLTVEGLHNFVAEDIIVHNSIEQDADMVMFLYRDEYYNPDSDDKGIAEVIIGKHRNGPTGKTQLAWLEQYTKFASLARRRD